MSHVSGALFVADDSSPVNLNVVAKVGKWYVCVPCDTPLSDELDDAHLFAAAPDLLVACETLIAQFADAAESVFDDNALELGRAAIAKAEPSAV